MAERTSSGWYRDPSGRHLLRYWNGTRWSEWVSDAGTMSEDATARAHWDAPRAVRRPGSCLVTFAVMLIVVGFVVGGLLDLSDQDGWALVVLFAALAVGVRLLGVGSTSDTMRWFRWLPPVILVVGGLLTLAHSTTYRPDPLGLSVGSDFRVECGSVLDPGPDRDYVEYCDHPHDQHLAGGVTLLVAGTVWAGVVGANRYLGKRQAPAGTNHPSA